MSDTIVMKRSCERCPAVEETPISVEDIATGKFKPKTKDPDSPSKYEFKVDGKTLAVFRYLCPACDSLVKGMLETVSKKVTKKASVRDGAKKK